MTVSLSVRVRTVPGSLLKSWLSTDDFKVLILDCRSFLCYNVSHILDAYNVHCPLLLKRRSKGPLPLEYVVTCGEARSRLLAGFYQTIVVYDENSTASPKDLEDNQANSNMDWVLETLAKETSLQHSTEICFLMGGFNQFSLDFPTLCLSPPKHLSLSVMPSPPAAPVNCSQSPTSRRAEHRVLKTPSPTPATTLRSPRSRRHRRGPALSLPNLKCVGSQLMVDHGAGDSSSLTQLPRSCSSDPSGPSYECSAPVKLLPHLYLGSNVHASRQPVLEQHGITAVLNVSRLPNYFPTCFRYMQIPVDDNTDTDLMPWFEEATRFIESIERCNGRVLVHCHAGISRSATICLAYIMKVRRIRLDEAFEFVRSLRTVISPNLAFMLQLLRFQEELVSSWKENVNENSPCAKGNSLLSNGCTTTKFTYPDSKTTPTCSPVLQEKGATRQLSIGNSPLVSKRMARSISLPNSNSQNSTPTGCGTPSRNQSLIFNFNLPILSGGGHSCALECPDLSPTPSPIFSPL